MQIKSYIPPFSLGQPINNFGVARVIRSDMASIPVGAHVHGYLRMSSFHHLSNTQHLALSHRFCSQSFSAIRTP